MRDILNAKKNSVVHHNHKAPATAHCGGFAIDRLKQVAAYSLNHFWTKYQRAQETTPAKTFMKKTVVVTKATKRVHLIE